MTKRVGVDRSGDSRPAATSPGPSRPEHWSVHAGTQGVARLDIPPDALRERTFELFFSLVVAVKSDAPAWHELQVRVDGVLAWSRRVATHPGGTASYTLSPFHGASLPTSFQRSGIVNGFTQVIALAGDASAVAIAAMSAVGMPKYLAMSVERGFPRDARR